MSARGREGPALSDQADRDAAASDLDRSLLVEAGAGTGKTTLLVERLVGLVRANVPVERIVAITFTDKAAAELKSRLRDGLERALKGAEERCAAEESRALRQALQDVEGAAVSTIHAFCAARLRELPVEAGIDPGFEIADGPASDALFAEVFADFLDERAQAERDGGPVSDALAAGLGVRSLEALARFVTANRDVVAAGALTRFPGADADLDDREVLAALERFVARAAEVRDSCRDDSDGMIKKIGVAERLHAAVAEAGRARRERRLEEADFVNVKAPGARSKWRDLGHLEELRALLFAVQEALGRWRTAVREGRARRLFAALGRLVEMHDQARDARGVLDFQDLLLRMRDLLRDRPDVRRRLARRFDAILVDEFQDTDPLQAEIVFFLAESPEGPPAAAWEDVAVAPGRLFLVGDPKQSIYRFRRADIEIYERARARLVACGGSDRTIRVNFRSQPGLLDWVNGRFASLIVKPEVGGYQPDYVPLEARPGTPRTMGRVRDGEPNVVILAGRDEPPYHDAAAARVAEADAIAGYLARLALSGEAAYRDCALLLRGMTALEHYEAAFRAFEVPYRVAGGRHLYSRAEVKAAVALFRAVDDPGDAVATVGVLRSPLFCVPDGELLRFVTAGGSFERLGGPAADTGPALAAALAVLRRLHERRHALPLPAFVEEVLLETRVLEVFLLKPGGAQRVANLRRFVTTARTLEEGGRRTFRAFVEHVRDMERDRGEEADAELLDEGADEVQILTVHKAKGLEWPVVVLGDLGGGRGGHDVLLVERGARPGFAWQAAGGRLVTTGFEAAAAADAERADAEARRLFYVAATRAKQLLVLPRFLTDRMRNKLDEAKDFIGYLHGDPVFDRRPGAPASPAWIDATRLPPRPVETRAFRLPLGAIPGGESPPAEERLPAEARAILAERRRFVSEASRGLAPPAPPAVTSTSREKERLEVEADAERPAVPALRPRFSGPGGVDFGVLVHRLMEFADFAAGAAGADALVPQARWLAGAAGLRDTDATAAVDLARRFLGGDLASRLARAVRLEREVPFAVEEQGVVLEGAVDLVAEEADGRLLIVDWKSDRVDEDGVDARLEHYRDQGRLYARALAAATGRDVAETLFVFLAIPAWRRV